MISVIIPTRKRIIELARAVQSIRDTSKPGAVEAVCYVDEDDTDSVAACRRLGVKTKVGPRLRNITQCWNECVELAEGDILCQGNDDIVFRTPGWDRIVEEEFKKFDDKVLMVHGNDAGGQQDKFGPHPFVHRRWVETLGYFIPPYFSSDFGDTWLNDLANALGRRRYLPFVVEHMHFLYGKATIDDTTRERLKRHDEDNVVKKYEDLAGERQNDIRKLRGLMAGKLWTIMILTQPSRTNYLRRLLDRLEPQVKLHFRDVEINIRQFDPRYTLGENREIMRQQALGEYINFIDDDDLVAKDYVTRILSLLAKKPDYVGFRLQCYTDGKEMNPTFHSLKYPEWTQDDKAYYRDISHLNPMKAELARLVQMEGGVGEDHRWADAMRGKVKTEEYVEDTMYFYYFRTVKEENEQTHPLAIGSVRTTSYPGNPDSRPCRPCPRCRSPLTSPLGDGIRCKQCGLQFNR